MESWTWALLIIFAAASFGVLAAKAWYIESRNRGQRAWEQLVRHRFHHDRPRMRRSENDRDQGSGDRD